MTSWTTEEGAPYPLGVSWCEADRAYNFAVYSKHATSVRLVLFGDDPAAPRVERSLDPLINKSGRVWHCRVSAAAAEGCRTYGYLVDGPEADGVFEAHAFHPEKLLLDPYARTIVFPPGFDRAAAMGDQPNLGKAAVAALDAGGPAVAWRDVRPPRHTADTIIYELHVRGFTWHPSSGVENRGTFAGLATTPCRRPKGTPQPLPAPATLPRPRVRSPRSTLRIPGWRGAPTRTALKSKSLA
jgi:glycogen operon protein